MRSILLPILAAVALSTGPAAAQGTAEQQSSCMGDAFRFCGQYIPDAKKIEACLRQNIRQISPECRAQFNPRSARATRAKPRPEPAGGDLIHRHEVY